MEIGFPGPPWRPFRNPYVSRLVKSLVARTTVFFGSLALHQARLFGVGSCGGKNFRHVESKSNWSAGTIAAGREAVLRLCVGGRWLDAGWSSTLAKDRGILSLLSAAILVPGLDVKGLQGGIPKVEDDTGLDQMLDLDDENGDGSGTIEDLSLACMSVINGLKNGLVKEPTTGVAFPATICKDADGSCNLLAGVGVRSKSIVKVKSIKVYAFALYVKPNNVKKVLGPKYAGIAPEVLKFQPEFYDDFLTNELDMTVRLVVHYRGLSMEMVRNAFQTSLRNRLAKIGGSEEDGLRDFTGYFTNDKTLRRGTTIDFRWQPGGQFHTEIDGKRVGTLVSPRLCQAFFDLYIGDPPVSQRAKQEIGESFARMLTGC